MANSDIIKKGHIKDSFTQAQLLDVMRSIDDPIYFIEKFIKVQHPIKGAVPLVLFPYQHRLIAAYHENRFCVALTGRQLGKCLDLNTKIRLKSPKGDEYELTIGEFYEWQQFKQWAKDMPELRDFICRQQQK